MDRAIQIDYDMEFIKSNITGGDKQPAIIDGLRETIQARNRESRNEELEWHAAQHDFYTQQVMESDNGVFISLHGTPITAEELNNQGIEPIFQVPEGCMVVMPAPPGTVVYGGEDEDMCSYRYFKQKLFMGAGNTIFPGGCFGADGKHTSIQTNYDLVKQFGNPEDSENEEEPDTIAERVSKRHEEMEAKITAKQDAKEKRDAFKKGGCTDEMRDEIKLQTTMVPDSEYGHEILENMQVFFPGDWVYNQFQEWEQDASREDFEDGPGGKYDHVFDIFKLGASVDTYRQTFEPDGAIPNGDFPPAGYSIINLKGNQIPQREPLPVGVADLDGKGQAKDNLGPMSNCIPYSGPTPNMVHTLSVKLKKNYGPDMKITTKELIERLCGDGTGPKMIVLNSCSPYRPSADRHQGRRVAKGIQARDSTSNAANLLLRNYCYDYGRDNFCKMRHWAAIQEARNDVTLMSVVPPYDEHRGITVAFTDDREDFYKTLGEFLRTVRVTGGAPSFTPSMFKTFLDLCDKSDKSGKLLKSFKILYNNFLSKLDPKNTTKSEFYMLPFDDELHLIDAIKRGEHDSAIIKERQRLFAIENPEEKEGGGKHRRKHGKKRKKRKTRKKKERKTRKRRKTRRRKKKN